MPSGIQEIAPNEPVQMQSGMFCLGCNYDLRGQTERRCPECGRVYDPNDPLTFSLHRPLGPISRFMLRPLGWPVISMTLATSFLTIARVTGPGGYFGLQMLAVLLWIIVGIVYLIRLFGHAFVLAKMSPDNPPCAQRALRWLTPPAVFVATIVLAVSELPFRAGLFLSHWEMDRLVQTAATLPPGSKLPDRRIGIYWAKSIETIPGGVRFLVSGAGFMDRFGFTYSSSNLPSRLEDNIYAPVGGNWYTWCEDW